VDAPPPPALSYSPDRSMFLQMYLPSALPPIYELARDELKLAGGGSMTHMCQCCLFIMYTAMLPAWICCVSTITCHCCIPCLQGLRIEPDIWSRSKTGEWSR
jgi:hypothetical protein